MNTRFLSAIVLSIALPVGLTACDQEQSATASQQTASAAPSPAQSVSNPSSAANEVAQAASSAPDEGRVIYEKACKICHNQGLLGAPKIGDSKEWQVRAQKGLTVLYHNAAYGFNRMPPQAVGPISEEQVKRAVDYLLANSQ